MQKFQYLHSCVESDSQSIDDMLDRAIEVTYQTIRRRCAGFLDWACSLGYDRSRAHGLTIRDDWHVGYFKSVYRGQQCYFVQWSGIEYIWVKPHQQRSAEPLNWRKGRPEQPEPRLKLDFKCPSCGSNPDVDCICNLRNA